MHIPCNNLTNLYLKSMRSFNLIYEIHCSSTKYLIVASLKKYRIQIKIIKDFSKIVYINVFFA